MLLLCGVFGCFRVCAEPESWPVLLGRVDGATAGAPALVFLRVGVGKEGEGTCWCWFPPPLFCCVERMTGLEPAASTVAWWRSSW